MRTCPHCGRPATLTRKQREEIRRASIGQVRAIARKFGVDRRTVQRIRAKETLTISDIADSMR